MAVANADVVAAELEKVTKKIPRLFDYDSKFWSKIKKRPTEKMSNRLMRVPLALRPGGAFQYFNPDGGDLGRGGGKQWDKAVLQSVFMSEGIEYTKLAEWGTDSPEKSVVNAVRDLTATAWDELNRQIDSQAKQSGNGVIGVATTVTAGAGFDTVTCTTDGFGVRLMRYGQTVQVYDTTLATLRGSAVITTYDIENNTIVLTPNVAGFVATDLLVTNGISNPAAMPGLYGVPYHDSNASTGTWLGFNRATTPEVRASAVDANNAPLTLPLPRLAITKIGNRIGIDNKMAPTAWMHPCQQQAYEEIGQLVSIIQKQPKEEGLNLYFGDNMQMAGAPVMTDYSWDKTRIDFITESVWGRGEILPMGFYKTDGRNIFELRGPSGGVMTADIFYLIIGMQLFVNNPAGCSYIFDLQVPPGYVS
jgi:hypothetical protein